VLGALAFFSSLGIWFESVLFVLGVLLLFTPALLVFVKVFEEREMEIRFWGRVCGVQIQNADVVSRKAKRLNDVGTKRRV